ncbi:MAG: DUF3489 domain-containing protein [Acidobacteriota bacterium]
MKTSKRKQAVTAAAPETEKPKATKKAVVPPRRADTAVTKGKSAKNASPAKKAPTARPPAKGTRSGSKAEKILELLKRKDGATLEDLMSATEWQAHSVRGFLSGVVRKKMRLEVTSTKSEQGERRYSVKA